MELAYKLAILPPIGAIATKGIILALGSESELTVKIAVLFFVVGFLAYFGWFLYKMMIVGVYPEEKGTVLKSFVLWFACLILSFAIIFA
ncbi:MAG: hypothetical protein H0Z18_01325 [Thermococcus sp.]|uniref:hypothetical protein n=1 Tax=Thermococcus sp. TaxID=35749 RepID=UPI001D4B8394|nr:hypothetical protein [Thermococcus sp.]MBO8173879.1 hypothetical protein [Thermococcus sp.]